MHALPPQPPRFSWDTVPVFMHTFAVLNETSAQYMARFPIVTMAGFAGKAQCCRDDLACCNEGKITAFASSVKAADTRPSNESTRVLYYQNTLINFPQTRLSYQVPEDLLLHDDRGRLVYLGGCGATHAAPNHTLFDHTQPALRALWASNVANVTAANRGLVDGVFCDRSGSIHQVASKDLTCYALSAAKLRAWDVGHWQTVADTQAALSRLIPTAIVIGNHAEPTEAMGLTNGSSWNGKMFEHFVPSRPYIPGGNQLATLKADHDLIAEVHVDFCSFGNEMYARSLAACELAHHSTPDHLLGIPTVEFPPWDAHYGTAHPTMARCIRTRALLPWDPNTRIPMCRSPHRSKRVRLLRMHQRVEIQRRLEPVVARLRPPPWPSKRFGGAQRGRNVAPSVCERNGGVAANKG
jgi:hypothetical protein